MKKITLCFIIIVWILTGCGGGSNKGSKSIFRDGNNSPVVDSVVEINSSLDTPSLYRVEQNETDIVAYIRENTEEAFKINGKDRSNIFYSLSTGDFSLCYIDPINGEVFFRKPTNYEKKSLYRFNVILQDSVGHRTVKKITIHIVDTKEEDPVAVMECNNSSLTNEESQYFISTWNFLENNETKLKIPILGDGYNYSVDWGDGTSCKEVTTDIEHTYATSGLYTVKIVGDFPRFRANDIVVVNRDGKLFIQHNTETSRSKLQSIEQWGTIKWKSMRFSFADTRLAINALDKPDLSNVKDMTGMFLNLCAEDTTGYSTNLSCGSIDLSQWDVSNVQNMSWMFYDANFEPNIGAWNVSAVKNMSNMFSSAGSFRYPANAVIADISKWNVSNVQNMSYMFAYNDEFNGDVSDWNVSNVRDMSYMFSGATPYRPIRFNQNIGKWDVSKVEDMNSMFQYAESFNQDIGKWDVSNVKNMSSMFYGEAWSLTTFNQNISAWKVLNVKDMSNMFNGNARFNQDLESWNVPRDTNTTLMFENTPSLETKPSWYK